MLASVMRGMESLPHADLTVITSSVGWVMPMPKFFSRGFPICPHLNALRIFRGESLTSNSISVSSSGCALRIVLILAVRSKTSRIFSIAFFLSLTFKRSRRSSGRDRSRRELERFALGEEVASFFAGKCEDRLFDFSGVLAERNLAASGLDLQLLLEVGSLICQCRFNFSAQLLLSETDFLQQCERIGKVVARGDARSFRIHF